MRACLRSEARKLFIRKNMQIKVYLIINRLHNKVSDKLYFGFSFQLTVSILHKSIVGRYRPVRVAVAPITASYRFIKNASWDVSCRTLIRELECNVLKTNIAERVVVVCVIQLNLC